MQLRKLSVIDAQKQMKFSLKRRARPMSKLLRMCALKAEMQFGIPEEHVRSLSAPFSFFGRSPSPVGPPPGRPTGFTHSLSSTARAWARGST